MDSHEQRRLSARAVSLFMLIFSIVVSVIIYFTNERLDVWDYLLMVFVPLGLTVITYFVVLYNDPDASD